MTGMFTGCGSSQQAAGSSGAEAGQTQTGDNSLFNEPGQLPIVNEPVTLTVFAPANPDGSWEDNEMVKELEETTGIHLEWQTCAASDNVQEKLSTMFASGDLPDIILTGVGSSNRYDKATEQALGEQGLILPLNDYLDTVSVGYKQALDEIEGMRDYITTPNGNIYSLPNVDGSLHVQYNMKLWINTQWLDNLGLSEPKNLDEFHDVLTAFKEQDANGNGDPGDEIPLSVPDGMSYLKNYLPYFGYNLDSETWCANQDGNLVYIPIDEGYKEFLRYFTNLYNEGLLDPASFTQNYDQIAAMGSSGDVLGCFSALASFQFAGRDQDEEYQTLTPFEGQVYPQSTGIMHGSMMITDACEDPATLVAWADQLFTQEGGMLYWLGVEGNSYVNNDDGTWSWNIGGPIGDDIATVREKGTLKYQTAFPGIQPDYWFTGITDPDESYLITQRSKMLDYGEVTLPAMTYSAEETETIASLKADLDSYINQYGAQVITGALDLDESWDNYVSTMNTMGASELFEIYKNAFNAAEGK